MKRVDVIIVIFWIGFSLFIMFLSNRYGLGTFHAPGPGLMPFLTAVLLLLISFYLLIRSIFKRGKMKAAAAKKEEGEVSYRKVSAVLVSLFTYALLLERLGYVIATLLTMIFLFRSMGLKRWRSILFGGSLTVLVSYFLFTYLGVRFPAGILRFLG